MEGCNSAYLVVVKLWGAVGCCGECMGFRVGVLLQCPRVGKVGVKRWAL
jgi:hypothetical protein